MTVTTVKSLFQRYKKNINDVSNDLFWDWSNRVNLFAYRIMYGEDPAQFMISNTITVSGATTALPAGYLTMEPLGCGFFVVNNGTQSSTRLPRTFIGSGTTGYYLDGTNIVFTNVATSTVLTQRYIPKLTAITTDSQSFVVPDEFIYYVQDAIDVLYDQWDEDGADEVVADQRFMRSLDNLALNLRKDAGTVGINTNASLFR